MSAGATKNKKVLQSCQKQNVEAAQNGSFLRQASMSMLRLEASQQWATMGNNAGHHTFTLTTPHATAITEHCHHVQQ